MTVIGTDRGNSIKGNIIYKVYLLLAFIKTVKKVGDKKEIVINIQSKITSL